MSDLIRRQDAIEYFMTNTNWHDEDGYTIENANEKRALLTDYFNGVPSAEPERKKGRWRHYEGYLTCSECRTEYDDDIMTHCCDDVPKFCPNCGARMEREEE